ncbi:MAG TPA: ATP-binding protein [Chloroflexota bacterium]|nr:ATP-binding protein [Chloroflexota bacterium]
MSPREPKRFDLNIERVLEHWTVAHALREIIANALDEQALTGSAEPTITRDAQGVWHIRDYGRGLRYEHLTQNEDKEKLCQADKVIGKFGVGLKDALATFDRHGTGLTMRSRHGDISIEQSPKHGFEDIRTLHALIAPPSDAGLIGTDVVLAGLSDIDMETAKGFFLRYASDEVLDTTAYGLVLRPRGTVARIYVNGLLVAEEENFLFSYNVTNLSAALRRALNRERTNVGRGAYSDRVKAILLASSEASVVETLADELARFEHGQTRDELQWIDVQIHACRLLSAATKVVFITAQQMHANGNLVDYARADGNRVVVVPNALAAKLRGLKDAHGQPIKDLDEFYREWDSSFTFNFVEPDQLTLAERVVFEQTDAIVALLNSKYRVRVSQILISETMRVDRGGYEFAGLWRPEDRSIVIKRNQLRTLHQYAGSLLHELTHGASGTTDRTLEFEDALTRLLGSVAETALRP